MLMRMPGMAARQPETRMVDALLELASGEPAALVVAGEPGIGKTTLWLSSVDQARSKGFTVLSARTAQAESVLAYGALADLLGGVDEAALATLPDPQRLAIERVLLRANVNDPDNTATDRRAVAAGFLSVVETLAREAPVLVAIDDLQWLDSSSADAVAFAARRLAGPVGVVATVRTDPDTGDPAAWLQLPRPDAVRRMTMAPLSVGALHSVIRERLGRSLSRPTAVRIHDICAGNPFYALELARTIDREQPGTQMGLPGTLSELVQARLNDLGTDVQDVLLAAACLNAPTLEIVAAAAGCSADHAIALLEDAEAQGITELDGHGLRFTHPLLAHGVYSGAAPARRRAMHRRLVAFVEEPELRARHLALAAVEGDSSDGETLRALDAAAESASKRGAPAAAAELLDLAMGLGGDTPARRITLASHHLAAGSIGRARSVLEEAIAALSPGIQRAEALNLLGYIRLLNDNFGEAQQLFERALADAGTDLALRVRTLVPISHCLLYGGRPAAAFKAIVEAEADAELLGQPVLLSQALSMRVLLGFVRGDGVDEPTLQRALKLEDRAANVPIGRQPGLHSALMLASTERLDKAFGELESIRRRCTERGEENDIMFATYYLGMIETWRGNVAAAAAIADDAMERAQQLEGDVPLAAALSMRAAVSAYAGRAEDARRDVHAALAASQRSGAYLFAQWPLISLGFLELSLDDYDAALGALEPLLAALDAGKNGTELIMAGSVPLAAETLISLGRTAEAEPLIDRLEANGRSLDRAWMLATGGRCRALLQAARGDLDGALESAQRAMTEHGRLPMPFERARTQLVLGQLQHRHRRKDDAVITMKQALKAFEDLNTPLWAERARAELNRSGDGSRRDTALTPSEQRVADLAATGLTNREVAAALFISPKTVEANLARVYRKLGIASRAELGHHMRRG
jgi:ATP/maltotriose-dependent transcriptional regulator MalT